MINLALCGIGRAGMETAPGRREFPSGRRGCMLFARDLSIGYLLVQEALADQRYGDRDPRPARFARNRNGS